MREQPIFDQTHNDVIGHKSTVFRKLVSLHAKRRAQITLKAKDRSRRSDRESEMPRDHLRLRSLAGTGRTEEHNSTFHLAPVKEDCHAPDYQSSDPDVKPHQCSFLSGFASTVGRAIESPPTNSPFAQEPIVVALDQMCLNLAHGIENHADNNQKTRAAEELRCDLRNVQSLAEQARQDRDE